jgi:hypothetical protein
MSMDQNVGLNPLQMSQMQDLILQFSNNMKKQEEQQNKQFLLFQEKIEELELLKEQIKAEKENEIRLLRTENAILKAKVHKMAQKLENQHQLISPNQLAVDDSKRKRRSTSLPPETTSISHPDIDVPKIEVTKKGSFRIPSLGSFSGNKSQSNSPKISPSNGSQKRVIINDSPIKTNSPSSNRNSSERLPTTKISPRKSFQKLTTSSSSPRNKLQNTLESSSSSSSDSEEIITTNIESQKWNYEYSSSCSSLYNAIRVTIAGNTINCSPELMDPMVCQNLIVCKYESEIIHFNDLGIPERFPSVGDTPPNSYLIYTKGSDNQTKMKNPIYMKTMNKKTLSIDLIVTIYRSVHNLLFS